MPCPFCLPYISGRGWKSMLSENKGKSISIIHTNSKELSIAETKSKDIRNKKQKLVIDAEMRTKIFILFFIRMHENICCIDL